MIKWIGNYSAEKNKNQEVVSKENPHQDEWRKKRNSIFVLEINHNRMIYIDSLVPADVYNLFLNSHKIIK